MRSILFVCIENSCRSQMAEAMGYIYQGDRFKVYSAGSRPSGAINAKAVEVMAELGYDLTRHRSKSLDEIPDLDYDVVVTMGCGDECPQISARQREDWDLPDPKHMTLEQFAQIRDQIEAKVIDLFKRLD